MAVNAVDILIRAKDLASREFQKLERSMQKVQKEAKQTTTQANNVSTSMSAMSKAAGYAALAMGAMEFVRLGIDLANLGESVRNTTNRFEELVGGAAVADAALERMRRATRGIADDASLMQGASDLLLMGIANTAEEATQIMELAIGLKRSTDSVADALNNFAIMMGNQSYLRLDSFGISAGRTRMRVEELMRTAQAATREDAFRMAVLEIGQETLERTSETVDETSTAFKRFKADVDNAMQGIAQSVEQGTNNAIGSLEHLLAAIRGDQERLDLIEGLEQSAVSRRLEDIFLGTSTEQRELLRKASEYNLQVLAAVGDLSPIEADNYRDPDRVPDEIINAYKRMLPELLDILGVTENSLLENAAAFQAAIESGFAPNTLRQIDLMENLTRVRQRSLREQQRAQNQMLEAEIANFESAQNTYNRLLRQGRIEGGFFDPQTYARLYAAQLAMEQSARAVTNIYREGGNVTEKMMNDINQSANAAERGANEAWRMVEAFRNADLGTLMGEVDMPRALSDLASMVSEAIGGDASDAFIEATERLSGARNDLTDFIENDVIGAIARVAEEKSPEAAARVTNAIVSALQTAIRLNLGPEDTLSVIRTALGMDLTTGESVEVKIPFVPTWENVARVAGVTATEDQTIEQQLATMFGIEAGAIDLGQAITVAVPDMSWGEFTEGMDATMKANLQSLIFGEGNQMTVTDDITINASRVTWGQIADWYGLSLPELISKLPPEAFGGADTILPGMYAQPGTYSLGGGPAFGPMGPGSPAALAGPFAGMDWSDPTSIFKQKMPQNELDLLVLGAQKLDTAITSFAETQFGTFNEGLQTTNSHLDVAETHATNIQTTLDTLTRSTWVIPVRVDVHNQEDLDTLIRLSMRRNNQDNGGTSPGTIPGAMQQGGN